jgi:hypothetical protein
VQAATAASMYVGRYIRRKKTDGNESNFLSASFELDFGKGRKKLPASYLRRRTYTTISSVARLGEISPFGRNFLALGAHFFLKNIAQMIWAQFFSKISPKIYLDQLQILGYFLS